MVVLVGMSGKKKTQPQALGDILKKYQIEDKGGYITREFQDYAYRLAVELDDLKRVSMYNRLAKNEDRNLLEKARSFVSDANARNKSAMFLWKLKQLKTDEKDKKKKEISGEQISLLSD